MNCPFLQSGLPPHPSPLPSLISSPFVCRKYFMYICMYVPPYSLWGGSWEEGKRGKGGGREEEGRMAKLKADAERLFSWTWEIFAGSAYQEHENVKLTWKMKPPFIHSFIYLFILFSPPPPILYSAKGSGCCKWVVCLYYKPSMTGPFWLCAKGRV